MSEDGNENELPKTASGKVMKNVLREWSVDRVGVQSLQKEYLAERRCDSLLVNL